MSPDFRSLSLGFPEFWRIQLPQSPSRRFHQWILIALSSDTRCTGEHRHRTESGFFTVRQRPLGKPIFATDRPNPHNQGFACESRQHKL